MAMGQQQDRRGDLMVGWEEMARSGSLSLWEFLRLESRDHVPDQSWLSKTRTRLPREAFKLRAEIVERSFAHSLDRGGMRELGCAGARTCTSDTCFMSLATISHC
jgi:hypothetical protein